MHKNFAKLQLSPEELKLVRDPAVILTKNSILRKVVELFGELSGEWRGVGEGLAGLPAAAMEPKISKGENYKGLPWVMLDLPRVFGREDVFAIRTMFWWGHSFSVTLHLKGEYMRLFVPVIRRGWRELAAAGFEVGISDEEWAHEHTRETYIPLDMGLSDRGTMGEGARAFFKLSARCGLGEWEEVPERLTGFFATLVKVLVTA